jgi:hypothetical protein
LHLKLAGAPLRAVAQAGEQLASGLSARVAVALEKRVQPLLTQPAGIQRRGIAAQERQRDPESTDQNTFAAPGQKVAS